MESHVGSVLRKARSRREVELSEVEAATRIRAHFLRAIESEEWDALPGGVYTRGFIRAYAGFLGLDGERLAQEYRREVEGAGGESGAAPELVPVMASRPPGSGRRQRSPPRLGWLLLPALLLIAALTISSLRSDGDDGRGARQAPAHSATAAGDDGPSTQATAAADGVTVRLAALAEVWVCLLNAKGEALVNGQILLTGAEEGPFQSGSFTVSFGNGEVSMLVDGKQAEIPVTPSPIGYSIDARGGLVELSDTERPTCT